MAASSFLRVYDPGQDNVVPGTLADIVRQYLAEISKRLRAGELNVKVHARYVRNLTHLVGWSDPDQPGAARLGTLPMATVRQSHFADYLLGNASRWPSGATKRTKIGDITACLKWAADAELIECNPWRKPKNVKTKSQPRREMRYHHYIATMRQTGQPKHYKNHRASLRVRQGLFFLWHTGARPCEFQRLQFDEIAWTDRCIYTANKTAHVTGEDRMIPLDAVMIKFLRCLERRRRPGQTHVFVNSKGTPWGACEFNRRFVAYARAAGVPKDITTHSARHGFACFEIRSGEDRKAVADQLGHVDTRMVERVYAAATRRDNERLADAADRRLERRSEQLAAETAGHRQKQKKPLRKMLPGDAPILDAQE